MESRVLWETYLFLNVGISKNFKTLCDSNKMVCRLDPNYSYQFIISDLEQQFSM